MRHFIIFILILFVLPLSLYSVSDNKEVGDLGSPEVAQETNPKLNPANSKEDSVFLKKPTDLKEKSNTQDTESSYSTLNFVRSFVILVIFLLIVFFLFRWLQKKKLFSSSQLDDNIINVLKSVNVQGSLSIQLVEIGKKIYILGVGDRNISLITEISDPMEIEEIRASCEDRNPKDFKSILSRFNLSSSLRKKGEDTNNSNMVFEEQKKRLRALKDRI